MKFGERLRSLREEKKITQKELAKLFKIAESTISMYERGEREPSFELLKGLADYFNVSVDYLMGRTDHRGDEGYFAFRDGGDNWTEEELEYARAAVEALRKMRKRK